MPRRPREAARRPTLLDNAETLRDLAALRSSRLEALRGDRAGRRSIRINMRWRICFR
ncbi:MAG: type II toxin-antitoxin system RelE/ParE family toxin [Rhodospirillales bacterium]|nr:type II toxin-antitoxin system RelE/ParE family toxin [Rhodospirillales bacterium]